MLTEEEMATLLGRSLTDAETTNFDLYLEIAEQRLEELLCVDLSEEDDAERIYESRDGYRTVYIDPATDITEVAIGDSVIDESKYTLKQNDSFNGSWYNIIEFDTRRTGQLITVTGDWGFETLPVDLQILLSKLFANVTVDQTIDTSVKQKKIEDFTVTYKDSTAYDELVQANASTISKYSQCNQGYVRHGRVCDIYPN